MTTDPNLPTFDSAAVVDAYAAVTALTPAEESLFDAYVAPGARVLDLGVGTGRTTARLRRDAASYVGVDLAPRMIETAAAAHPGVDYLVGDAADLSFADDAAFDVVVFSYNGLDYLVQPGQRERCLGEVARVLAPGGAFIFSTHDPRAIIRARNRDLGAKGWPVVWVQTARRLATRPRRPAFWTGSGIVFDQALGGLVTFMATPDRVRAQLEPFGFAHRSTISSRHPRPPHRFGSEWWYHVFTRTSAD